MLTGRRGGRVEGRTDKSGIKSEGSLFFSSQVGKKEKEAPVTE